MPTYLTPEGKIKIKVELQELKEKRPQIAERIKAAREQGDLSENAEYGAAKDEQAETERKIKELENLLHSAVTVDNSGRDGYVRIGATVTLRYNKETKIYTIVGKGETDPFNGKISYLSPMGQALLEKKIHEEVIIQTPKGKINFEIIKIE